MGSLSETVSRVAGAVAAPVRLLGRALGYAVSLVLLVLALAVVVTACTLAWLLVFHAVDLTVGLSVLAPPGVLGAVGLPEIINGIPLFYPMVLGILTSLLVGLPTAARETDFSPPILPY